MEGNSTAVAKQQGKIFPFPFPSFLSFCSRLALLEQAGKSRALTGLSGPGFDGLGEHPQAHFRAGGEGELIQSVWLQAFYSVRPSRDEGDTNLQKREHRTLFFHLYSLFKGG